MLAAAPEEAEPIIAQPRKTLVAEPRSERWVRGEQRERDVVSPPHLALGRRPELERNLIRLRQRWSQDHLLERRARPDVPSSRNRNATRELGKLRIGHAA